MAGTAGVDDSYEPSEAPQLPLRIDRHGLGERVGGLLGLLYGDAPAPRVGGPGRLGQMR